MDGPKRKEGNPCFGRVRILGETWQSGDFRGLDEPLSYDAHLGPLPVDRWSLKGQSVAFKISKQQLVERDALAADLRKKAEALNSAIVAFNQAIEPLSQAVHEAMDDYNEILEKARALASSITEAAQEAFDAKSEKWQSSDKGIEVRSWIEQWEVSLDDVDLELPEPLDEVDPDDHAGQIEDALPHPTE